MKILVTIAVFVVLVSAIFILYTYDNLMSKNVNCIANPESSKQICSVKDVGSSFIVGIVIIGFLVLVDFVVVFVIAKFLASPDAMTTYVAS